MPKRRTPTRDEIKRAICDHGRMDQTGPSEQVAGVSGWRTAMACPGCGWSFVHLSSEAVGPARQPVG